MPLTDGTDPAVNTTPIPLDGDGDELIGMVVDARYRLDSTIGRGGMGLVFRATHLGLRRQVAVKILHPALAASPDVRSRFEREALAVGKIDHPNCVATYDVGRLPDGALYLAMELLEGKSLADVLEREGQLAPGRALHILAHILKGLGHIHDAGMIHRDIKPENIFLIRVGDDVDFAKILDFGIAKPMSGELSDDGVRLTQAGMAFGTPIYMAPEQALGNKLDGRADIYAAAVMAYEMLCGQPPFYSDDKLEVMSMHTAKPVPPMRSRLIKGGRPVPSSLEKLILRGLTKKPSDRYPNAEAFLAAVEAALDTKDGGQTDVNFERLPSEDGAEPLIGDDGELRLHTTGDFAHESPSETIGEAISEVLALSTHPGSGPTRVTTPDRGQRRLATPSVVEPETVIMRAPKLDVDPPVLAPGDARGRQGGVGIGLPYTGPLGQPIFGLTPEQRLAQVPKRRWPLYAGIVGVAVAAGIAIALITAPGSGDDDAPKLDPSTPAGAAAAALQKGDPAKAIQILDAAKALIGSDPQAFLLLGHAHAAQNENADALAAYKHALELDAALESDRQLRANLRVMATDKEPEVVMNAFAVWYGKTQDPEAKPALLKAVVSQSLDRRHAARPVVDAYNLASEADLVTSYGYDLEQEATCDKRAEAVGHLRALNDPKAIPALQRAVYKRGPRNRLVNGCLTGDAKAAIGYLSGLKK